MDALWCIRVFAVLNCITFIRVAAQGCNNHFSPLIQPGPGAIFYLRNSNGFIADNKESFSYTSSSYSSAHSEVEIRAYFLPTYSGIHNFFGTFTTSASFTVYANHSEKSSPTSTSPSLSLYLRADFRYKIQLSFKKTTSAKVGVEFPNGTRYDPMDSRHVFRSMNLYDRQFVLHQIYDWTFPHNLSEWDDFKMEGPKFINKTVHEFQYAKTLSSSYTGKASVFTGAVSPPAWGNYSFTLTCSVNCKFILIQSGTILFLLEKPATTAVVELQATMLCLTVWMVGSGNLIITRYDPFGASIGEIQFSSQMFNPAYRHESIQAPVLSAFNATALRVTLYKGTRLISGDRWQPITNFEVLCYNDRVTILMETFHITTDLSETRIFNTFTNYTYYQCYANHFGFIDSSSGRRNYNLVSAFERERTAQNVPSAMPGNLKVESHQVKEIKVTWDPIPTEHHEGAVRYRLYFKAIDSLEEDTFVLSGFSRTFRHLENKLYETKICGYTDAGEGPCSNVIRLRPLLQTNQVEEEQNEFSFETNMMLTNKALVGHIIGKYTVHSVEQCFRKCSSCINSGVCTCASFNIEHTSTGGSRVCEINEESSITSPQNLHERVGYQHFQVHTALS